MTAAVASPRARAACPDADAGGPRPARRQTRRPGATAPTATMADPKARQVTNPWDRAPNVWERLHAPGATPLCDAPPAEELRGLLHRAALPLRPGELVAAQIRRAGRTLGLPDSRAREIWYGRARRILAEELDRARAWRRDHLAGARERMAADLRRLDAEEQRLDRLLRRLEGDDA